jgi:hypothetical protein
MAAVMLVLSPPIAEAGFITIDPAGMNALFSQPSFDGTPIDIRFNQPTQIVDPELLDINSQAKLAALVHRPRQSSGWGSRRVNIVVRGTADCLLVGKSAVLWRAAVDPKQAFPRRRQQCRPMPEDLPFA